MIDTQAIRIKILDLALRGKLTEQLPEDGTAEELYRQIQAEKQALIKAGKIKKEKPLPEIAADEVPFEIPKSWKWVRLAGICSIINGDRGKNYPAKSTLKREGIPFISALNLNGVSVTQDEHLLCLDDRQYKLLGNGKLQKDDIVICIRGSLGKHGRYPFEKGAIASSLVISRLFYSQAIMGDYEMIWLDSSAFPAEIERYDNGTAQPNLAANDLEKFLLPLPPLAEQHRIVARIEQAFSALDTIDTLQAKYADNLAVLKSKLIDAAIQGKLTEQLPEDGTAEDLYRQIQAEKQALIKSGKIKKEKPLPEITHNEWPFEIPNNWKWVRLGSVARVLGGKRIPAGRSLIQSDTGHKYIRVSDMKNRSVQTKGLLFVPEDIYPSISQYIINKEDVYITVAGTIGRVGKIPPEIDGANLTENADRIVFSHLNQDWLIFCLSSSAIQKQIEMLTTSVAQPKLAIQRIQDFQIPLPPLAEQKRIVAKLEELLPLCERVG